MPAPFGSYADVPPAAVIESFSPPEAFDRNQLFVAQTRHFVEIVQGAERADLQSGRWHHGFASRVGSQRVAGKESDYFVGRVAL